MIAILAVLPLYLLAHEGEIEALELDIGRALPADHRALLTSDVSRAQLGVLAPHEMAQFGKVVDETNEYIANSMAEAGEGLDSQAIGKCWVVLGFVFDGWDESKTQSIVPRTLWCPELPPEQRYFAAGEMRFYPTLTDIVRAEVARLTISY